MEPTTSDSPALMTPLASQVQSLKQQHPDTLLFFRLGDFYETFNDDAQLVARELEVTLTSRSLAPGHRCPMAGVPAYSIDHSLALLIARGHKVAIAEQLTQANDCSPADERAEPGAEAEEGDEGKCLSEGVAPAAAELDDTSPLNAAEPERDTDDGEEPEDQEDPDDPVDDRPQTSGTTPSVDSPPSTVESEVSAQQVEQAAAGRELKIVIRLKPSPGGYRAALSISTPQTDVVSAIEHVDGIAGALAAVPRFIEQAEQVWASSPRYPRLAPAKAAADAQPTAPPPPAETAPDPAAPQLSLF